MHDVWRNPLLFWRLVQDPCFPDFDQTGSTEADFLSPFHSVVIGFVITFPLVYIPGLNEVVFRHASIGWEWAPAFIAFLIFAFGVEGWKYVKRIYFRRRMAAHPEEDDGMTGIFAAWKTTAVTDNIQAV